MGQALLLPGTVETEFFILIQAFGDISVHSCIPKVLLDNIILANSFLDAQKYFPLSARQVIGLQFYFEGVNGEVPFSILPPMGGSQYMRGYYEGRFRDNIFTTLQGEWRFPIKSRFRGGVFVGIGEVAGSVAELSTSYVEFSGGSGLRYRLNEEGIHIRLDYAIGEKGNGLYITTLQPF